jgi:hypothetical protein
MGGEGSQKKEEGPFDGGKGRGIDAMRNHNRARKTLLYRKVR